MTPAGWVGIAQYSLCEGLDKEGKGPIVEGIHP